MAGQAKDVEALLWKSVFYKPIEEFRRRIRKAHESGPAAAELLHKATKTLGGFLADAATFYKHLVMRLQVRARVKGATGGKEAAKLAAAWPAMILILIRSGASREWALEVVSSTRIAMK